MVDMSAKLLAYLVWRIRDVVLLVPNGVSIRDHERNDGNSWGTLNFDGVNISPWSSGCKLVDP